MLDNIGGAQLLPEMSWEAKNANRSVNPFLTASPSSDTQLPAQFETAERRTGLYAIRGQVNSLRHLLQLVAISHAALLSDIAHLVPPNNADAARADRPSELLPLTPDSHP